MDSKEIHSSSELFNPLHEVSLGGFESDSSLDEQEKVINQIKTHNLGRFQFSQKKIKARVIKLQTSDQAIQALGEFANNYKLEDKLNSQYSGVSSNFSEAQIKYGNITSLAKEIDDDYRRTIPYLEFRESVQDLEDIILACSKSSDASSESRFTKICKKVFPIFKIYPKGSDTNQKRKMIQEQLNNCLRQEAYQDLKTYEEDPLVHFLHMTAIIIHHQSEGMSAFESYGRNLVSIEQPTESYDLDDLKVLIGVGISPSQHGFKAKFKTLPLHPKRGLGSLQSVVSSLDYDAYKKGNYNAFLGFYKINDCLIGTSAGPNPDPEQYPIFAATLQAYKNLNDIEKNENRPHLTHLQVVLEGAEKNEEAKNRRNRVIALEKDSNELSVLALPLDGDAWKQKGVFEDVSTTAEFLGYTDTRNQHPVNSAGIHFPEKFSPQQSSFPIKFVNAFSKLEKTNTWKDCQKQKKLSKALLLGFNAIIAIEQMQKLAENATSITTSSGVTIHSTCNMACKQGIDRGAIQNLAVRMLVDASHKGEFSFSESELMQYFGYLAGRAESVEARNILEDRVEALVGLISMLSELDKDDQKAFLAALDLQNIEFIPSYVQPKPVDEDDKKE